MEITIDIFTPSAIVYYVIFKNGKEKLVEILNYRMCGGQIRIVKYTYYIKKIDDKEYFIDYWSEPT